MKALSVKELWASLIIGGWKPTENRTWPTSFRGPLLICASKKVDLDKASWDEYPYQDDWDSTKLWLEGYAEHCSFPKIILPALTDLGIKPGYAIGVVDVIGCDREIKTLWDIPDQYHWRLQNPRPVKPFPVRGQLGLFEVRTEQAERETEAEVEA